MQPNPKKNNNSHIADQIVEEVQKRKRRGVETYGNALQPFNGRDATQDALEEALDLAHYIKQWQIEREALLKFVDFAIGEAPPGSVLESEAWDLASKFKV